MLINTKAPDFKAAALMPDGSFQNIQLSSFTNNSYVILFFYPFDFTFVCPSEIIAFSNKHNKFEERNTKVLGVSIDSKFSHYAWSNTEINNGGIGKIKYPLISDIDKSISRNYNVLINESMATRGTFIINKEGIIVYYSNNGLSIGRNVDEFLRIIDAIQHNEKHGEVCPAGWNKGDEAIKQNPDSISNYLSRNKNKL